MKKIALLGFLCLFVSLLLVGCSPDDTPPEAPSEAKTVSVYVDQTDEWLTATYDEQSRVLVLHTQGTRFDDEIGYYTLEGLYSAPEDGRKIYAGVENENRKARLADGNAFSPNVRLYSKWEGCEFTVYFRTSDNKGPMHFMSNGTIIWAYGDTKATLPIPTRSSDLYGGKNNSKPFAGWRNGDVLITDPKGKVKAEYRELLSSWYSSSEFGTGRLDLQPVYLDINYRITYVLSDGSEHYAHVKKGDAVDFSDAPVHFVESSGVYGWSLQKDGELLTRDFVPEGDVTLYAQYRGCKIVRFYHGAEDSSNAERYTETCVFEGESLKSPYPTYRYYTSVTDTEPVSFPVHYDDIKLAYFRTGQMSGSSISPTPCRIVYQTGGLVPSLTEIEFMQQTTFPLPTPTVDGYAFDGWYLDEGFGGKRVIGVLAGEKGTPEKYNGYYLRLEDETLYFVMSETTLTLYGRFTPSGEGGGV